MKILSAISLFFLLSFNNLFAQNTTAISSAEQLQQEAQLLTKDKKLDLANEKLLQAQKIYQAEQDWENYLPLSIDIAMNYYRLAKDSIAISTMESAIQLSKEKLEKNNPLIGLLHHKFGVIWYFLKDYDRAIQEYKNAIVHRKAMALAVNPDLAGSYYNLALCLRFKRDYDQAIPYFKEAIKIRKLQKDTIPLAQTYWQMGNTYRFMGDYKQSLSCLEITLDLYSKIHDETHRSIGIAHYEIGHLYSLMDRNEDAVIAFQKALQVFNHSNDQKRKANTLHSLGHVYTQLKMHAKALEALREGLEIHQEIYGKESIYAAKGFNSIGLAYKNEQKYSLALDNLNRSLAIRKKVYQNQKHPNIAISYDNIGNVLHEKKVYTSALTNYQLALCHLIPEFNDSLSFANPNFKQVLNCNDKPELLTILIDKASSLKTLFQTNKEDKYLAQALQSYKLCTQLLEEMKKEYENDGSKLFWSSKVKPFFEEAIETALSLFEITQNEDLKNLAFSFAEKSKASLLVENRKEIAAQGFANIPKEILQNEKKIKSNIVALRDEIYQSKASGKEEPDGLKDSLLSLNNSYNDFVKQLEKDYPKYYRFKYSNDQISINSIQKNILEESTCLVEFFFGANHIYVFAISKNQTQIKKIVLDKEILTAIQNLRLTLSDESLINQNLNENYQQFTDAAHTIYFNLLKTSLPFDQSINKLILIPDGLLSHIPFECLLTEEANLSKVDFLQLPYLLKQYEISYAYSSNLLKQNEAMAKSLVNNNRLIAFAPDYTKDTDLLPLSGAQEETDRIVEFYPNFQIFKKEEATKYNFIKHAGDFGIVHLALHASVDAENSERSCLYFSNSKTAGLKDNLLYNYELYALDLKAKLVVLSACETGAGQELKGEGVMSLARGFMDAGTSSVVMSLWSSNDKSSQQLMVDFHRQLSENQVVSTAMHLAKLDYLKNPIDPIGHPYYWAGFIATGSTSKIEHLNSNYQSYLWVSLAALVFISLLIYCTRDAQGSELVQEI